MDRQIEQSGIITCIRVSDVEEALALGRSSALNSPALRRAVVVEGELPKDDRRKLAACFDHIVPMRPEHFRLGWQAKNVVHHYSPFERTLFLDADCLVMRDLRPVFERFRGKPVAFSAKPVPAQETGASLFAKVSLQGLLAHFGVDWWPQILGGGHFYFERCETADSIFACARAWADLERLRPFGWDQQNVSDELTLQFALVDAGLARQCTVCDLPFMLWTPSVGANPDVLAAVVEGRRPDGTPFTTDEFHVVHFGGDHHNVHYRRERYRLAWQSRAAARGNALSRGLARLLNRRGIIGPVAYMKQKSERLPGRIGRMIGTLTEDGRAPLAGRAPTASGKSPSLP